MAEMRSRAVEVPDQVNAHGAIGPTRSGWWYAASALGPRLPSSIATDHLLLEVANLTNAPNTLGIMLNEQASTGDGGAR